MTKLEYAIEGTRRCFFCKRGETWLGYKELWEDGTGARQAGILLIECIERIVRKRVLNTKSPPDPMLASDIPNAIYLLSNPVMSHGKLTPPTEKAKDCVTWLEAIRDAMAGSIEWPQLDAIADASPSLQP
jgi:hypothetical protein